MYGNDSPPFGCLCRGDVKVTKVPTDNREPRLPRGSVYRSGLPVSTSASIRPRGKQSENGELKVV